MSCGAGNTARSNQKKVADVASRLRKDLAVTTQRVEKMIVKKNHPDTTDILFEELLQTQYILRDLLGILTHG